MQNPRLILILCLLTVSSLMMSANYYSRANGNWNNNSTWSNSSGGKAASSTPGSGDVVYIERGYTVTVTTNAACSSLDFRTQSTGNLGTLVLNEGNTLAISGTLTLQNHASSSVFANISGKGKITTTTLNIGDNTNPTSNSLTHTLTFNDSEVIISGSIIIQSERGNNDKRVSNGVLNINSGNFTVNDRIETDNYYPINTSTFTLGNNSPTLVIKGNTPFAISGTGTSNITLNGTGATVDYAGANQTVYNSDYYNLTLSNSGTKTLQTDTKNIVGNFTIDNVSTTAVTALTIGGDVLLNKAYNVVWGSQTHNVTGNWTRTGWGSSNFTGSTINFTGNNSSTITEKDYETTFNNVVISKSTGQTLTTTSNLFIGGNYTLNSGKYDTGSFTTKISGNWENNGGTLTTASGEILMNGSAKTIGGSSSTTFNNLTINNNADGITLTNHQFVNGNFKLDNGLLKLGIYNLTLGALAAVTGSNGYAGNMIIADNSGQVRKLFTGNGSFTFPIGDAGPNYSPITLNFASGTYSENAYAAVNVTNAKHPQNSSMNNYLTRYWSVVQSGISGFSCTVTGSYPYGDDVVGQENLISVAEFTGALPWVVYPNTLSSSTFTASDVSTFGDFTGIQYIPPSITTGTISSSFCAGSTITVPFTIAGAFNNGNVFTAQLSNASGSFASPVSIGTLASTTSGTISATIPVGTATGTGYRIRVISSIPVITGSNNGSNLTITSAPNAPTTTGATICIGSTGTAATVILSASGAISGQKYVWYNVASDGTPIKTSTNNSDNTYTTPSLTATTNYWVSILNTSGCEGPRTQVTATYPSASSDNQNAAETDTWIGHVYDGLNFDTYYGSYTEAMLFNQNFGGSTNCFPITSNSSSRSIYTETFSVRYRMNSSLRGLYAVDLGSDDGSRLTVDGAIVYNNWTDQAFTTKPRVLLSLTGSSNLMYEFYENGGGNQVVFENGVQIITNTLTTNLNQTINQNSTGATISGDVFGTLPVGIALSGTGYQWTYSTSPSGPRTVIPGATGANYTPNSSAAPFNTSGTYYIFRNAILSSSNNVSINPYISTNESNYAVLIVESKPFITANPTTLTGFTYAEGNGPSQEQPITIQGSNLTSNIIIYPPASFEISKTSAAGFTSESPLTLNASGGAVANTTIYVRMKAGFPQGTVAPEFIQATANSADTVKISASGIVTTGSVLTVGTVTGNFTYQFGAGPSAFKSFTVSGTNLQSNITITAPSDFQVSTTSGSGYSNSITLNRVYNSGTGTYYLNSTTVYVRLIANLGVGTRTQDVQVSATAATTKNVSVTGIVTPIATILNPISLMGAFLYKQGSGPSGAQSFPISGYNLSSGITITGTTNYEISLSSNSGFTNSITLPQSAGIVNTTNIYVRLKAGISAQTLAIESILLTSTGATIKSIGCRGIVSPLNTPTIAVSTPSLSGFGYQAAQGGPSPVQSFVVSGARLSADIIINAPTNYEISNNPSSGFNSTYTVTRSGDKVDPTTIYVRLVASKPAGDYNNVNITLNSTGATEQKIALAGKVFTSPLIQAGGGGGYCIGSTINLTSNDPDGSIQNLYWDGPNGYYSTAKNPSIPNANINNSGNYTVNANVVIGGNLITNGDFELGNTSFGSAYEYPPLPLNTNSLQPEGRYAVVDLPSQVHNNFSSSAPDHTPSPGTKQMVINGNTTPGAVVWSQTVNVIAGSDYEFTYWLQTVVNGNDANPSKLQLYVNGIEAGPVYTANPTTGVWEQFVYNTKSGTSNILNLELINQNTIAGGNDFALDDIVFQQILTATSTVKVEVNNTLPVSVVVAASANPVTQGTTVTYTATPTNGGLTPTYKWLVNNQVVTGATSPTYSYVPNTGDQIKCVLTSSLQCVTNNPASSNTIAMTVTQNVNYWRGTNSTDWGTASNWTANFIPLAGDNVVYATVANYGSAAVRDLVLDQNRTIGSLINATNKRLVIPAAKSLTVNNTITVTPPVQNPAINLADLIYIYANPALANGSLSFKNAQNNPVYASVEFYSKSSWDLSKPINQKYNWQYFGIPVDTVKASPTFDGAYVRERNEAGTDTTTHWTQLTNDSYIIPFKGYEICYQNPKITLIQGKLVNRDFNSGPLAKTSTSVVPDVLYPGQILLANPYTAAIDIRQITFGSDVLQTIYMYNTGTFSQWTVGNQGTKLGSQPGQYTAVPKNLAGSSGIPLQIPSMSSFLVFVSNATADAYLNLAYNSVIMGNTEQNRVKSIEKQQFVSTMVDVVGETGGDRMWLFTDKNCSRNFDNGYDARKLTTPALSPQIYAVEQDGNYQINTINDLDNTTLAFQAGQDTEYTMTFTHENADSHYQKITLYDVVAKTSTDITANGSTYTFSAQSTAKPINRFKVFTNTENDKVDTSKFTIFSLGNTLSVYNNGTSDAEIYIFDIAGRKIAQRKIQSRVIRDFEVELQHTYIVKIISNEKTETHKIIIQ